MTAAVKGEDVMQGVLNGAADGFMNGAITGAITGGMQGAASFMKSSKMMGSLDEASHFSKKVKTTKGCPKDCFAAGTMVKTEGGYKAIEEIEVGDKVWSWDEATGEQALKTVVQLFRNEKDVLVHIDAAGEQIQTTLGHPFYVVGKGWVKAGELKSGDVLKLYDGKEAEINSISIKESKPVITYNFEVEDSHTYYVTQSDVLCYNACGQNHHVISNKINKVKLQNSKLDSISRNDPRFQVKALTSGGHKGYQKWHRQYDKTIVDWLKSHPNASAGEFINKINSVFAKPGMVKIFGKIRF